MKDQRFTDGYIRRETEKYMDSRPKSPVIVRPRQWKPYIPPFESNYGFYVKSRYDDFITCCESKTGGGAAGVVDSLQAMCLQVLKHVAKKGNSI